MDSSTLASIIIAIIAALASTLSVYFTYYTTRQSEDRATEAEINKQLMKYSQPLLISAFDFQARLYELVDYPISSRALECAEGREDLFKFTCYRLARFLASSYILRETTHFLSMRSKPKDRTVSRLWHREKDQQQSKPYPTDEEKPAPKPAKPKPKTPRNLPLDENTAVLRDLLYKIDDELDRRRDASGRNYGVFPSSRLLISERMLIRPDPTSDRPSTDIQIKDWTTFLSEWDASFREPCAWFVSWLETFIEERKSGVLDNPKRKALTGHRRRRDDHFRCLQHLLCDLVYYCDIRKVYNKEGAGDYERCRPSCDCDCTRCGDTEVGERHKSRLGDGDFSEE